jgi:poly(A) polymerase
MTVQYGITKPIMVSEPTADDRRRTQALEATLRAMNLYESIEESEKREEVLGKLNAILKEWVQEVCISKVMSIVTSFMTNDNRV